MLSKGSNKSVGSDPTYMTASPVLKSWFGIVIVDTVEPTPTADGANDTGLTTNLFATGLNLNKNSSVLFGEIFNLKSFPSTKRCWSSTTRVAAVLIAFPITSSVIFSILWLLPVDWSVKKIKSVLNPTLFVVDNPIKSLLNFTHIRGSTVLKSNGFAKLASKLDFTIPSSNEVTFNLSPVLNLCPGIRIELGIEESIVAVLVKPVTILLEVLPIPTDLL